MPQPDHVKRFTVVGSDGAAIRHLLILTAADRNTHYRIEPQQETE